MEFKQLFLSIIGHFHRMGYLMPLFAAWFDTIIGLGLLIPGSAIILFMGALAAKGYFNLAGLICCIVIGAIIGDNINYSIGKKYGAKILKKSFCFVKPIHFKKGEKFFERHGSKSVFIARFIPSMKETIPLIAGILGMDRLSFVTWNTLGVVGWTLLWTLSGYFFTQSLDVVKIWLIVTGISLAILFSSFILF